MSTLSPSTAITFFSAFFSISPVKLIILCFAVVDSENMGFSLSTDLKERFTHAKCIHCSHLAFSEPKDSEVIAWGLKEHRGKTLPFIILHCVSCNEESMVLFNAASLTDESLSQLLDALNTMSFKKMEGNL